MKFLRDNGLTIVLMLAFLGSLIGMLLSGLEVQNQELAEHGAPPVGIFEYFFSGDFLSPLFENWESEFLQMSAYVLLTAILFQRGSAESKDPDKTEKVDEDPKKKKRNKTAPWPVRAGGFWTEVYSYSLGIALGILFVLSFVFHWLNSVAAYNEDAAHHGQPAETAIGYLGNAELWFESFQNWQSEFLSTAVLVVLSIFLRFRGSPDSKPVAAPHSETGSS